ncbi:MAG: hypothetical protein H8D97_01015 [Proteobacteria bacterium]|nr:hypothetical protein [Pseudomonadota bacterium]
MAIQTVIENLRVERNISEYFESVEEFITDTFEKEEDQNQLFEAVNTILKSDTIVNEDKLAVIDNFISEVADKSCHEGRWKRPKQISWGARPASKVTWGKGVNAWFSSWK